MTSQTKERPILFNGAMVRAILEGRKTVTRRAVKSTKAHADGFMMLDHGKGWWPYNAFGDFSSDHEGMEYPIACPYGQPGDRVWVRESWQDVHPVQVTDGRYKQEGRAGIPGPPGVTYQTIYRADGSYPMVYHSHAHPYRMLQPDPEHGMTMPAESGYTGWTPSIHMPRWACRILLEITKVRVERLQDISDEQCAAEGVRAMRDDSGMLVGREGPGKYVTPWPTRKEAFRDIWEATGGNWDANPWVWVVEFKQVTP